jgi:hypothetical protein
VRGHGVGNLLEPGDRLQEAVRDVLHWRSFMIRSLQRAWKAASPPCPMKCGR